MSKHEFKEKLRSLYPSYDSIAIMAYLVSVLAAIGLQVRTPFDIPKTETGLTYFGAGLLFVGGVIGIAGAVRGKNWLEQIGANAAFGGSLVGLMVIMFLDVAHQGTFLSRPVWTVFGLAGAVLFFWNRSKMVSVEPYREGDGPPLPATEAIGKADEIRKHIIE